MASNDKTILFFLGEEEIKTMVSALMKAYSSADMSARYSEAALDRQRTKVGELTKKLEEAEAHMTVQDAEFSDLEDEYAELKDEHAKLVENVEKLAERKGE